MMSEKARLFNDLETREEIMKTKDPKKHKQLGRLVRNFDKMIWNRKSYEIVLIGNRAKFTQNEQLKEILVATGKKQIAEASPMDRIWGIGVAPDNPLALDSKKWRGKNMLGTILMQVRSELQQQDEKD